MTGFAEPVAGGGRDLGGADDLKFVGGVGWAEVLTSVDRGEDGGCAHREGGNFAGVHVDGSDRRVGGREARRSARGVVKR